MDFCDSIDDGDDWINNIFDQSFSPISNFTSEDSAYASSPDIITTCKNAETIVPLFSVEDKSNIENFTNNYNDNCYTVNNLKTGIESTIFCNPNKDNAKFCLNGENPNLNIATNRTILFENFLLDNVLDCEEKVYLNLVTEDVTNFEGFRPTDAQLSTEFWERDVTYNRDNDFCELEGGLDLECENNETTDVMRDVLEFYRLCPELKFEEPRFQNETPFRSNKSDVKIQHPKKARVASDRCYGETVKDEDSSDSNEGVPLRSGRVNADKKVDPSYHRFTLTEALFAYPPLKEGEVILTDEEKRSLLEEGLTLPLTLPLRIQDAKMLKKIRRKIKNRMAAQESRRKQKEYLELMESRMEMMRKENNQLKEKLCIVENNNRHLNTQLENYQNLIRFSGITKNKTCLMVLIILFAVSMGTWSPASLNLGRVLVSQNDVLTGLGPYLPAAEKGIGEDRLIGPDVVQPSVQYYFQVQDQWTNLNKEEPKQEFYYEPLIPSQDFCFGNLISYIRSYKSWNAGHVSQDGDKRFS